MELKRERIVEFVAVVFNLLYTFYYLRGNPVCFLFGVLSPVLFIFLTWEKKIYADTMLQIFYVGMSVYGYLNWGGEWKKIHWSWDVHTAFIVTGAVVTLLIGFLLSRRTDAKLPYLDSFTTVFAMTGTWMMMNFVHENWLYFMVINTTSIVLFTKRKLYTGALMFIIYLVMSVDGYFELNIFNW